MFESPPTNELGSENIENKKDEARMLRAQIQEVRDRIDSLNADQNAKPEEIQAQERVLDELEFRFDNLLDSIPGDFTL